MLRSIGLLVLLTSVLEAADSPSSPRASQSWDNLATLRAGQKIEVKSKGEEGWKGTFLAFTADSISIRIKKRDMEIHREEVKRIKVKSGVVRLRHTLIGAGVGAGAGAAIAAGTINQGEVAYAGILFAGLAMISGTVVGAVLPANSTVYEAGP